MIKLMDNNVNKQTSATGHSSRRNIKPLNNIFHRTLIYNSVLSCVRTILYLPKQSGFHVGGKAHSIPNTKALSVFLPSTPPFLLTVSKNSQMPFTWERIICNCYFISALCYSFSFARINISVGIQHSIITFIARTCASLRKHLSSLKICVLCLMLEASSLGHLGKYFQNSQAWKNESSIFSDETLDFLIQE